MPPIEPASPDLQAFIGADYFDTFSFWQDQKNNVPYDFTQPAPGWSQFQMTIGTITLTQASGLTVVSAQGQISPAINRTTTATQRPGSAAYLLSALDPNGKLEYLMFGLFFWRAAL